LKTLEKINRKGNRNSRKKEKANLAQTSPLSPAPERAPSVPDRRAPLVGTNSNVLTPSLSLAALCGRAVGTVLSPFAYSLSLSLCPTVPTCQPSLTSRPRSPCRGRAHVRAFSGHVLALMPLLSPAPCLPTSPRSFAPSAKPSPSLSRSAHVSRELCHRPPLVVARSAVIVASVPRPVPR
jgi:hypothetical protein